ncbi:MAG: hypothetical protein GXP43_00125 [bacterium]|nr:hypothetical protein [bacterium]
MGTDFNPSYQPVSVTPDNIQVEAINSDKPLTLDDYLEFFLRLFLILIIVFGLVAVSYFFASRFISGKILTSKKNILFVTPYKMMVLEGFGVVSEPEVSFQVKTKKGYKKIKFLLDSGAVVSSLPREIASQMGYNLAFLPRTMFFGYGNKSSFAYKADMVLKVGQKAVNIPVVFTETKGTQPLIGRKGFFDNFAIIFDAKNQQIVIKAKE